MTESQKKKKKKEKKPTFSCLFSVSVDDVNFAVLIQLSCYSAIPNAHDIVVVVFLSPDTRTCVFTVTTSVVL